MRNIFCLAGVAALIASTQPVCAQTYGYDDFGRLTSVLYVDGSKVVYQYDAAGNRTAITKTPPAPVAGNVSLSVAYNTAGSVTLTPTGVYSSLAVVTMPAHGTATISGTTATFTPGAGYYGGDSFTYRATGPGGNSNVATVSVTVGLPAAPSISNKSLTVAYNSAGTVSLTPTGVYSSVAVAASPTHGTASISGTTATFTPTTGYYGTDSFTYTASGPGGTTSPATVSITVAVPNAPTVGNVSASTGYNTATNISLAPSGVYGSLAVAGNPAHGTASISGTTASYTPTAGYYGADSFTYTATGPGGTSSAGTVNITVGTPAAPAAGNVSLATAYNTSGNVGLSGSGVYSSFSLSTNPSHGSASISGSTANYTPTSGYYGADSFTYIATGPGGNSSPATVSVSVATPAAPTVGNVSLSTAYNTGGSVNLAPSGVYTSLSLASNPAHGSASVSGTTANYTPTSGYYGSDSFTYIATGPGGNSSSATVNVTVATPAAPSAGNTSMSTAYNTAGTVNLAPSGVYNSLSIASNPAHGSASISGTTATYTPAGGYYGADSFTYVANGPGGSSAPATVGVSVGTPAAPTVGNVSSTVTFNTPTAIGLSPSGAYSSLAVSSGPAHGSVSISGTTATFTPATNYFGSDSFTYTASGPGGTSAAATVTLSIVDPNNHAPTCTPRVISTSNPNSSVNPATFTRTEAQLLSNCTDPDGDVLHVISPSLPASVTIFWGGIDSINFTVTDNRGGTANGSVTISRP